MGVGSAWGWTTDGIADLSEPKGDLTINVNPGVYAFYNRAAVTGLTTTATEIGGHAFDGCSGLTKVHAPFAATGQSAFARCTNLLVGVVKTASSGWCFEGCGRLQTADIRSGNVAGSSFKGCANLQTIILRGAALQVLSNTNAFDNSAFKSGGTGGTIYIPKSLFNHLGDGTASDYKAANNWATIDGYGTITWAQIEGSAYDGCWADGTPIRT